jgi:hypothetical protein
MKMNEKFRSQKTFFELLERSLIPNPSPREKGTSIARI